MRSARGSVTVEEVTSGRRPRVAIAVEPTILADALADVLLGAGVDDVVNLRTDADDTTCFDAALVTVVLPDTVDADVVIELPDTPTGAGETHVSVRGYRAVVPVTALDDVLGILDDYCPAAEPRRPH